MTRLALNSTAITLYHMLKEPGRFITAFVFNNFVRTGTDLEVKDLIDKLRRCIDLERLGE